jgi:F0F1-type ATP synthase membrane subunit b/b'
MNLQRLLLACAAALALFLAACEKEGPAERAGKAIDQSAEQVGDKIEDATDKAGDALERAGEKVEEKVED